jgi:mitogen-activated protein kinase kinase kinase 5
LDFGEANVLEIMYNADIALIDLSIDIQKNTLFYHLGVRESFGMKENILTYNDFETEIAVPLKLSCTNYPVVTYLTLECGSCVLTMPTAILSAGSEEAGVETKMPLAHKIKRLLQDVEIQSKSVESILKFLNYSFICKFFIQGSHQGKVSYRFTKNSRNSYRERIV